MSAQIGQRHGVPRLIRQFKCWRQVRAGQRRLTTDAEQRQQDQKSQSPSHHLILTQTSQTHEIPCQIRAPGRTRIDHNGL